MTQRSVRRSPRRGGENSSSGVSVTWDRADGVQFDVGDAQPAAASAATCSCRNRVPTMEIRGPGVIRSSCGGRGDLRDQVDWRAARIFAAALQRLPVLAMLPLQDIVPCASLELLQKAHHPDRSQGAGQRSSPSARICSGVID